MLAINFCAVFKYFFIVSSFAVYSRFIWLTTSCELQFPLSEIIPSPFDIQRPIIKILYKASLIVTFNVMKILYCNGCLTVGVTTRPIQDRVGPICL